jgi:hypothetical protein
VRNAFGHIGRPLFVIIMRNERDVVKYEIWLLKIGVNANIGGHCRGESH